MIVNDQQRSSDAESVLSQTTRNHRARQEEGSYPVGKYADGGSGHHVPQYVVVQGTLRRLAGASNRSRAAGSRTSRRDSDSSRKEVNSPEGYQVIVDYPLFRNK